jgi:catechol 2,3-dioxygenase-like lactoylglutathione lyase family enzyme
MIDHLSTYAIDYERTRTFYDAVFATLGYTVQVDTTTDWDESFPTRRITAYGPAGKGAFWIIESLVEYTPRHVALTATSRAMVDAFHVAGLAAGGTDHGAPGVRPIYHPKYYGAFLLDPDGNNIEAVCHDAD